MCTFQNHRGFTLIELMVVVAVIGILAAIAVPAYSDYLNKSKRSEGYEMADQAHKAVQNFFDHTGRLPVNNAEAGLYPPESYVGNHVASMTIEKGQITVTFAKESNLHPVSLQPQVDAKLARPILIWVDQSNPKPTGN